jgi:ADP-ribose pyrophosphatase YjhB (NUDIX family)
MNKLLAKAALLVMVFTLIAGIGALVTGITNYRESRKVKPKPQIITAANLAEHGPGENHFVQLSEFVPQINSIVVEGGNRKTSWDAAYVPLFTAGDDIDAGDPPRIILYSSSVKDQPSLDALATTHTLTGMISPWDIDEQTKGLFKKFYPRLDTTKCYILHQDDTPPGKSGSMFCMTLGVVLLGITVLVGFTARNRKWGEQLAPQQAYAFAPPPSVQSGSPIRLSPITSDRDENRPSTMSPFVANLRKKVGTDLLMLSGISAVVLNDQRQILLVRDKESGYWMPIGGMIEPGEEPADAAIREVFEETSVRVVPEKLVGVYDGPAVEYANGDRVHYITIVFLCKAGPGIPYPQDGENTEARYFEVNQIPPMRADHERNIRDAMTDHAQAIFRVTTR